MSVTVTSVLGGGAVAVGATGAADEELGAPAMSSATAAPPSRQIEAAIQGVAGTGERMACQRGYGIKDGIPARLDLRK
jgi:hypothetical protein